MVNQSKFLDIIKNDVDKWKDELSTIGATVYCNNVDKKNKRYIVVSSRNNRNFNIPGVVVCNHKAISIPLKPPINKYKKFLLNSFYNNEKSSIVKITEGTHVTIYWFNNKWTINTFKSFDMNDVIFSGGITYQEALLDCLNKYPDFSLDKLDKKKCYTLGFKHYKYHPFPRDNTDTIAWFVRSVELEIFNDGKENYYNYTEDIGLPLQSFLSKKEASLQDILKESDNAYEEYKKSKRICYGFIIRIGSKQLLIESSLLRAIRTLFYRKIKIDKDYDRLKYLSILSYMSDGTSVLYKDLFPETKLYDNIENTLLNMVNIISEISLNTHKGDKSDIMYKLANHIHNMIRKTISISDMNTEKRNKMIINYIYNTVFMDLMYGILYGTKTFQ